MADLPPLSKAFLDNLLTIQRTQRLIDRTTRRLASGLDISSALDDPKNFFLARELEFHASDLSRRLDGISQSIRTVEEANHGAQSIEDLLDLAESIAVQARENLSSPQGVAPVGILSDLIQADAPDAYWRLDDIAGATAINLGAIGAAVDGTYLNGPSLGETALYDNGGTSVRLNGTNQGVDIPDHPLINASAHTNRTVELVFNADSTAGRQVLYEEGANVNSLTIYIEDGRLYVTGRDQGAWGPPNISIPISSDETYHVAFTFDSIAGDFIGYVNGTEIGRTAVTATFPSHVGDIGIGFMNQDAWFHDGVETGTGNYFSGRISDVALYNITLTAAQIETHAAAVTPVIQLNENEEFNRILDQITQITQDAHYRGTHLLALDNLTTLFNEDGTSALLTEGVDFTSSGLGIKRYGFNSAELLEEIIESVREARQEVRQYSSTLKTNLSILTLRENFTNSIVNTLLSGAQDLTQADINEEGANLLALQTRQQLGYASLSFASAANNRILNLFA